MVPNLIQNYRAYTAFPDFSLPQTEQWWINLTVDFHKELEFDGLWIVSCANNAEHWT